MINERDTKFAGFAKLLATDIESMYSNLVYAFDDGDIVRASALLQDIQTYIAQRAYDLAVDIIHLTKAIAGPGSDPMTPSEILQQMPPILS